MDVKRELCLPERRIQVLENPCLRRLHRISYRENKTSVLVENTVDIRFKRKKKKRDREPR